MVSDFWAQDHTPEIGPQADVPRHLDALPDGREVVVIGDVERLKDFNHLQGDNGLGFQGTCGIVSCQDILRQFGVEVSEDDLVRHAASRGLCNLEGGAGDCGGTTVFDQAQLLHDWGVSATVETNGTLESLAEAVESGRGTIAEVNAGVLWDRADAYGDGGPNHAIVVTGVARDASTGEVVGVYINDSGVPDSGKFIDAATFNAAWAEAGGLTVSTLAARGAEGGAAPGGQAGTWQTGGALPYGTFP